MRLAVPALGALIAEPLFLMADTAIVGHLGVVPLAGVALASSLLQTAVGLLIFLAYGTTPAVARLLGAGRRSQALAAGKDGLWLAFGLGVILVVLAVFAGRPLLSAMGGAGGVLEAATTYLMFSLPGLPAMLLVLAATGVLRGLQDGRTPLIVAVAGFSVNAGLDWLLVYGAGMGVAGAALGTSITQWAMALVYLFLLLPRLSAERVSLAPHGRNILALTGTGGWLFLRSASLRLGILAMVFVATDQGGENLAGHQIVMTMFNLMSFALDAIAIAAQSLIGKELGAGNLPTVHALTRRMVLWGVGFGVLTGVVLAVASPWLGWIFTADARVPPLIVPAVLLLAVSQPICGVVFVLDGVLIGAGDIRYLALAGVMALAVFLALLVWVWRDATAGAAGLGWLWASFALGYLSARAGTLLLRAGTDRWQRVGE